MGTEDALERSTKTTLWLMAAGAGTAALTYHFLVRPWHKRWGAEPIDIKRPMPGDDLVSEATEVTNRGITIEAEPPDIWPSLIQFAVNRRVEHARGQPPEADRDLRRGDRIDLGFAGTLEVVDVQQERWLVLAASKLPVGRASWSIMLNQFAPQHTRLVCRGRFDFGAHPRELLYRAVLDPITFVAFRRWFRGVADRAERAARARQRAAGARNRDRRTPYSYGHRRQHPSES